MNSPRPTLRITDRSRYGIETLAHENGWELFSEVPGAIWTSTANTEGAPARFSWHKPNLNPESTRKYVYIGARGRVGDRAFTVPLLTPWKVRKSNPRTQIRPEFAKWFTRNQLRYRAFRTGAGTITLHIGPELLPGALLSGFEYVLDVIDHLPIDAR